MAARPVAGRMRAAVGAFCMACLVASGALARAPVYAPAAAGEARPLPAVERLERRFLQVSAANLQFQAEASRLAASRSGNPAVHELADTLLARQQTAQPELLRLLHRRGMALPPATSAHGKVLKRLARLQGARFDQLYVTEVVVRSHRLDIANHETLAAQGRDPVLKAWIDRQLPTLRFHLAKAGKTLPGLVLRAQRAV